MAEIILRAARCGKHFDEECQSCRSADEMSNNELDDLRAQLTAAKAEVERLREAGQRLVEYARNPSIATGNGALVWAEALSSLEQALQDTQP